MARREELQEEQWALIEPLLPKPATPGGRAWAAPVRGSRRAERDIMDSAFGRPLARLTRPLPLVSDLSSALSGLGAGWHVGARPAGPRGRLAGTGWPGSERMFH